MKKTNFAIIAGVLLCTTVAPALADENRASQILTKNLAEQLSGSSCTQQTSGVIKDTAYGDSWASTVAYDVKSSGAMLSANIRHFAKADEAKLKFERAMKSMNGSTVSGIGDAAFRTKGEAQHGQLNVLKGKNYIVISAGKFGSPDTALQDKVGKELVNRVTD